MQTMELEIVGGNIDVLEIAVRAVIMYIYAVALLRIFGKRTTMTTAGFDLILTVALGSILASTIVSTSRPIFHGMAALMILVAAQWLLSLAVSRSTLAERIVVSPARVLLREGKVVRGALREERLSEEQLEQSIRLHGFSSFEGLRSAILESSGNVSVIDQSDGAAELVEKEEIGSRAI